MPDQQIKVSKPALQAEPPRRAATRVTHPAPHPPRAWRRGCSRRPATRCVRGCCAA